jgi:hypothetical protein
MTTVRRFAGYIYAYFAKDLYHKIYTRFSMLSAYAESQRMFSSGKGACDEHFSQRDRG